MSSTENTAAAEGPQSGTRTARAPWQPPTVRVISAASAEIGVNTHMDGNFTMS